MSLESRLGRERALGLGVSFRDNKGQNDAQYYGSFLERNLLSETVGMLFHRSTEEK